MALIYNRLEKYDYVWVYYLMCSLIAVFFRVVLNYARQEAINRMFLFSTGIILGYSTKFSTQMKDLCKIYELFIQNYGTMYTTLCFFQMAFVFDLPLLRRYMHTILKFCLSAFIIPLTMVLVYFTFVPHLDMTDAWPYLMLLVMISVDKGRVCREHRMSNNLILLMDGECFILNSTLMVMNSVFETPVRYKFISLLGIIAIGTLIGNITKCFINVLANDENAALIIIWAAIFITIKVVFFSAYQVVFLMGIVGLILNQNTLNISFDTNNFMRFLLNYTIFVIDSTLSISFGILTGINIDKYFTVSNFLAALFFYGTTIFVRILTHFIVLPLISPLNFGLSMNHLVIGVFSASKGNFSIFYIWKGYQEFLGIVITLEMITMITSAFMNITFLRKIHVQTIPANHLLTITSCLNDTMEKGKMFIASLKINRFFSFVDWDLIFELTKITNPYVLLFGDEEQLVHKNQVNAESSSYLDTTTLLPNVVCGTDMEGTEDEEELFRKSKLWMLKMKRKSYEYQYNNGKLKRETIVYLRQWVSLAMDKDVSVEDNVFYTWYKRDEYFCKIRNYILQYCDQEDEKPPMPIMMKFYFWHEMVWNSKFENVFIAINILFCVNLIIEYVMHYCILNQTSKIFFLVINCAFLGSFTFEFLAKVLAYSQVSVRKGFGQYFKSHWNKFNFFQLMVLMISVLVFDVVFLLEKIRNKTHKQLWWVNFMRLSTFVRFLLINKDYLSKLIYQCDKKINYRVYANFDLAMACLTAQTEVLNILDSEIRNLNVRKKLRQFIEARRQIVLEELILIECERPWVAVTVKNQQVAQITIADMTNTINQLQSQGWLEPSEVELLKDSCLACSIYCQKVFSVVPIRTSLRILKQNSCFTDLSPETLHYLVTNSTLRQYKEDEVFVSYGNRVEGIFLITSGSLIQTYKFRDSINWQMKGLLPVVEILNISYYKHDRTEYFSTGFFIGLLSFLTGRPFECDIVAHKATEGYFIPYSVMQRLIDDSIVSAECLYTKMWLLTTSNLVISILLNTNYYHTWSQAQLKILFQRAFIPKMDSVKTFIVNNLIEDVILLEGIVSDMDNKKIKFYGPCYIPRSVRQLKLTPSESMTNSSECYARPTLMLITVVNVRPVHILIDKYGNSTMNTLRYQSCLKHAIEEPTANVVNAKALSRLHLLKQHKTASFRSSEDFDSTNIENKYMLDAELTRIVAETDTLLTPMASIIPELQEYMAMTIPSSESGSMSKPSDSILKENSSEEKKDPPEAPETPAAEKAELELKNNEPTEK